MVSTATEHQGDTKDKGKDIEKGKEQENEKKDEQEKDVEGEDKERKKVSPEGAAEEGKRAKENSKKDGDEFFVILQKAENQKDIAQEDHAASPRFGFTRTERANGWRERVNKNIASK